MDIHKLRKDILREQAKSWINLAKLVHGSLEFDESGNERRVNIYQRDEKLYVVEFLNGKVKIKDEQFCAEVTRHTRRVEEIYYCDRKGHEIMTARNDD